ncbi:hypothetical protein BCU33_018020 [Vibrio lentus]|uniref:hypothetical protein n=1 Tax=Vibrio lentus TaxID=136468 RepID=UPI000C82C8BA|nr:hypothetical protein [Vibrio lentus]PMI94946.1 hypothetical protein BCU33_16155 [Vibrio lentus]
MSRSYSELDKKIINSLIGRDGRKGLNVLGNIIEEYLDEYYYINVPNSTNVSVMLKEHYLTIVDINEVNSHISDLFLSIVVLFDDLVKERFIYFTGDYQFSALGNVFVGEQYVMLDIIDTDLKEKIHSYTTRKFFITENLKEFVKNDYQSKEEIAQANELKLANKQLRYTRIALGTTFLGLMVSILVPILSTTSITLEDETINISSEKATIDYIDNKLDINRREYEAYKVDQNNKIESIENTFKDEMQLIKSKQENSIKTENDQLKTILDRMDKNENEIKSLISVKEVEKNKHNKLLNSDS